MRADKEAMTLMPGAVAATEEDWGKYAFSREPLEGRFSNEQKMQYTHKANDCGREWAEKIARQYGTRNPGELAEKSWDESKNSKSPGRRRSGAFCSICRTGRDHYLYGLCG